MYECFGRATCNYYRDNKSRSGTRRSERVRITSEQWSPNLSGEQRCTALDSKDSMLRHLSAFHCCVTGIVKKARIQVLDAGATRKDKRQTQRAHHHYLCRLNNAECNKSLEMKASCLPKTCICFAFFALHLCNAPLQLRLRLLLNFNFTVIKLVFMWVLILTCVQ